MPKSYKRNVTNVFPPICLCIALVITIHGIGHAQIAPTWVATSLKGCPDALASGQSGELWSADSYDSVIAGLQCRIRHSSDFGMSYTTVTAAFPQDLLYDSWNFYLRQMAHSNGNLWVSTTHGLYRIPDKSGDWTTTTLWGTPLWSVTELRDGFLYAGGETAVYRSSDGGSSWKSLGGIWLVSRGGIRNIGMENDGTLWAMGDAAYRLRPNTTQWEKIKTLQADFELIMADVEFPHDGSVLVSYSSFFGGRIFRSEDGGNTWSTVSPVGINEMAIAPDGTIYAGGGWIGETRGIYRSADNGKTWQVFNNGLPEQENIAGGGPLAVTPRWQIICRHRL